MKKELPPVGPRGHNPMGLTDLHAHKEGKQENDSVVTDAMKEKAKEILKIQANNPLIELDDGIEDEEEEEEPAMVTGKSGKQPTAEEVEERRKYLEATRNLIMKKRMEERKKELLEFEHKQPEKDDFYQKLMEIERLRKQKGDGKALAAKLAPDAPEGEEEDDEEEEHKAQIEANKMKILRDA